MTDQTTDAAAEQRGPWEQVGYWKEKARQAEAARDAVNAHLPRYQQALSDLKAERQRAERAEKLLAETVKPKGPRRRIMLTLQLDADDWDEVKGVFRHLETQICIDKELSRSVVSGGYGSGYILQCSDEPSINHDSWAAENDAYCKSLRTAQTEGAEG